MVLEDLRRLRILRELAERQTLSAVAAAMAYSPSAVSQQLAVLEKEAGQRLIEPAGRGVRLTEAGRVLAGHAAVLLQAAATAENELAVLAEAAGVVQGRVRAVGLQSAARRLLIPALVRLRQQHPGVDVEVSELELEQALPEMRLGSVDVVISDDYDGYPRPRPAALEYTPLLRERTWLVLPARHGLAADHSPVPIAELAGEVWTSSSAGTGHHAMVIGTCRALGGFEPDLRHRSNDADVQLELVRHAGAVTLLPELTLPAGDPTLALRPIDGAEPGRSLYTVTRRSPGSPALRHFLAALTDHAAKLQG